MGRRRQLLDGVGLVLALAPLMAGPAHSQPSELTTTRATIPAELPPELAGLLCSAEDYSYGFDEPGYYALLGFVQHSARPPGAACTPIVVNDWRELVERPSDFRGQPVTIEGVVGRNKDAYTQASHPELGRVWRVELSRPDQASSCTVIFTSDVSDLPMDATIRVTGYFVKVYRYATKSKTPGLAALLVAQGPTQVSTAAGGWSGAGGLDWRWLAAAVLAALVVTVVLLRRSASAARRDLGSLQAQHPAPQNLADDLAEWAARQPPNEERPERDRQQSEH